MQKSGLLTSEQLQIVFINLEELIAITNQFSDQLLDAVEQASEQGDEVRIRYLVINTKHITSYH